MIEDLRERRFVDGEVVDLEESLTSVFEPRLIR